MAIQPRYLRLAELLENRLFRIPHYQRAYSWRNKQRADMFEDINKLTDKPKDSFHFMATVVGLRSDTKTIVTDEYSVIEVVDGQQRLTTLVLLLKAIEKKLSSSLTDEDPTVHTTKARTARELKELLVKPDELSLILLQTNHDRSEYFANFIRHGIYPNETESQTLADRELLRAIDDCESFVSKWKDHIELLRIVKNQLTFIFHETDDEAAVYTVFEVLNNRGLNVSWLDRLKSMLMAVAFEDNKGNSTEHIKELHQIWGNIYAAVGLRQGLNAQSLRFAATLKFSSQISALLGEEKAVDSLINVCKNTPKAITVSDWILKVTKAIDWFMEYTGSSKEVVTTIVHARLLAVAIILRNFSPEQARGPLEQWEKTTFRIFGLCRKDARTGRGDYVRLAWDILNCELNIDDISGKIKKLSKAEELSIDSAIRQIEDQNCYSGWEAELRYLLFRYEEHLAKQQGLNLSNEQWNLIWEESAANSIEHILPQSSGSEEPLEDDQEGVYVHRLGNLLLLPLGENSRLGDKDPEEKVDTYERTGFYIAREVAQTIKENGWGAKQVEEREQKILEWIRQEWS